MTIAIVINTSWNIFNFRMGLLKALQKDGHKIICIAPKDQYTQKLKDEGFIYHNIYINNKGTNPIEDSKLIYDFYRLYKSLKPDVILQYTIKPNVYGSIAARILNIPVISNVSGFGTMFLRGGLSAKLVKFLYKLSLKKNRVFFQNSEDREFFIKEKIVNEKQTDLVPGSGIDTTKYEAVKKDFDSKTITFLMVARLVKDKGINEYIEAAKTIKEKYKNITFRLIEPLYPGNPTAVTEDELQMWIDDDVVDYLGASDEVIELMKEVDCVVLPSYREGLSRVLLEAGCLGLPIITTNVPGCKDVVDDGKNGFLCEVKNFDDLALKMEKYINLKPEEKQLMAINSRIKCEKVFDESFVISKYKNYIGEL